MIIKVYLVIWSHLCSINLLIWFFFIFIFVQLVCWSDFCLIVWFRLFFHVFHFTSPLKDSMFVDMPLLLTLFSQNLIFISDFAHWILMIRLVMDFKFLFFLLQRSNLDFFLSLPFFFFQRFNFYLCNLNSLPNHFISFHLLSFLCKEPIFQTN